MRYSITYIIILFALTFCKGQAQYAKALDEKGSCQLTESVVYTSQNGLCSNSIILNGDSTFLAESGCEGRSRITIGTWTIFGDSIKLAPSPIDANDVVCNIENLGQVNKNQKTIFFFSDKAGKPVPNFYHTPIDEGQAIHFYFQSYDRSRFIW